MEIETKEQDGIVVLSINGEIDLYNAPELKEAVQKLSEQNKNKIIVNLDRVSYVDSSGIGALISSFSNLKKQGGSLRICNVAGSVRKVFELTKLTSFFEIDNTEADSLSAFK